MISIDTLHERPGQGCFPIQMKSGNHKLAMHPRFAVPGTFFRIGLLASYPSEIIRRMSLFGQHTYSNVTVNSAHSDNGPIFPAPSMARTRQR
jgi:hypothetical protein